MSVSDRESGIVDSHIKAIEATAASRNTFIFIRPTEYDSTILIRAGYATKSMDVHHKSSNWGPAAGFVPCDPAFSKKCEGKPNPNEDEHPHGAASPVQLSLKASLLASHSKIAFETAKYELGRSAEAAKAGVPWVVKRKSDKAAPLTGVAAARAKFEEFQEPFPNHKFCVAAPEELGNKATVFVLTEKAGEWFVWWVDWKGESGWPRPLRVFAYPQKSKLVPVTGDYDLWMVAPHFSHFTQHVMTSIAKDVHGSSAASAFTLDLNQRMNNNCGRGDNPVFNHGAESQNYGFTQALDQNLAMFTPNGGSRMIRMNQMPSILGDLQQSGYLVVWNKRYGESDPRLMSKADERTNLGEIRANVDTLFGELDEIRKSTTTAVKGQIAKEAIETKKMPSAMKSELAVMANRFQATRTLGLEQSRIYRFNRQLLEFLSSQIVRFRALSTADFPSGFRVYESGVMRLHQELQLAMVSATKGAGQSDESTLAEWLTAHKSDIDRLKTYWS